MIVKISPKIINNVSSILKRGGLVICPTDTVYGFLADASNKKAVDKIYKIKKRPKSKPLPVFVKNIAMAKQIAHIDSKQEKRLKKFWPGKYTFILKRNSNTKLKALKFVLLYGIDKNTIALRIPKHAFLQKLLKKVNRPLVQTSVNISSQAPLRKIDDIIKEFGSKDILIIDGGKIETAKLSKIIDLSKEKIKIVRK